LGGVEEGLGISLLAGGGGGSAEGLGGLGNDLGFVQLA